MNTVWSELDKLTLGQIAEHLARVEFAAHGWEVFPSMVDNRGVDFVAKHKQEYYEVQVKSIRNNNYTFLKKDVEISDSFLICYIRFIDGNNPKIYVFPSTVWHGQNALFVNRSYEYGINCSNKNLKLLKQHEAEEFFNKRKCANDEVVPCKEQD